MSIINKTKYNKNVNLRGEEETTYSGNEIARVLREELTRLPIRQSGVIRAKRLRRDARQRIHNYRGPSEESLRRRQTTRIQKTGLARGGTTKASGRSSSRAH